MATPKKKDEKYGRLVYSKGAHKKIKLYSFYLHRDS